MKAEVFAYRPDKSRREYIDEVESLNHASVTLTRADAIGVDVEMGQRLIRYPGGTQEWRHILALIQIASAELSIVVDPLRCTDLSPLRPLMAGSTRKVFLGGGQDVSLLEAAGIPAHTVADVGEVAYAVFGRREDGMAALSKRIFALSLDKTVRRADWMVRPLNPALISYAFQDAELTLLIYRWFEEHHPDVLAMHERRELEPQIPLSVSHWLRDAILRGASDAQIILAEHNLDPGRDAPRLTEDVASALQMFAQAPRRLNRLIRIAGDIGLKQTLPEIVPFADSPSCLLRASTARAIGKLADRTEAEPILSRLHRDPIEDVRKAADAALRDLNGPKRTAREPAAEPEENDSTSGLGEETLAALQQLMQRLEGEST